MMHMQHKMLYDTYTIVVLCAIEGITEVKKREIKSWLVGKLG